jgi:anthranilate phosphoribosyltransferase
MRTVFNILGPLTNPAGAQRQLLGAFSPPAARLMAAALRDLCSEHALVVHGSDGLDEITTTGPTLVLEVRGGEIAEWEVSPEEFGLPRARLEDLAGGDAARSAEILLGVLAGAPGAARDIVLLNAAAGLYVGGAAADLCAGLEQARAAIDSGAVREKLEALRRLTVELDQDEHPR